MQGKSQDGKLDALHAFKKELNLDESSGRLEKDKHFTERTIPAGFTSFEGKGGAGDEVSVLYILLKRNPFTYTH